jgi:predicted RNase H-like HicB family nuclease
MAPPNSAAAAPLERNVWVLAYPAEDVPGQWVGHCLDLDVVSVGTSLDDALRMTAEAVALCLQWDAESGLDPFARSKAPGEAWELLDRVVREGRYGEHPANAAMVVATQFHIAAVPRSVERLPPTWMQAA